mgnify:CR=1 FL=1
MFNRIALAVAATLCIAGTASATNTPVTQGTVTFNGTVTASACSITTGVNATVDLGTVESGRIRNNDTPMGTEANIALTACSNTVLGDITFTDVNAGGTATSYIKSTGTATGVGVKVYYKDGSSNAQATALDFSHGAVTVALNGGATFGTSLNTYINGQMVPTGDTVAAGSVVAKLNYSVTYK